MLTIFIFLIQCFKNSVKMFGVSYEISIGSIHEKRFDIVLLDILRIGLLQIEQVIVGNRLLITSVSFLDVFL